MMGQERSWFAWSRGMAAGLGYIFESWVSALVGCGRAAFCCLLLLYTLDVTSLGHLRRSCWVWSPMPVGGVIAPAPAPAAAVRAVVSCPISCGSVLCALWVLCDRSRMR